ncbi:hypothetical protein QL285_087611 [Trifolium repens]|nr:hypothetical protein QL285_087611 [Trifolium repens]
MVGSCPPLRPSCSPLEVIPLLRVVVNCEEWIIVEEEIALFIIFLCGLGLSSMARYLTDMHRGTMGSDLFRKKRIFSSNK